MTRHIRLVVLAAVCTALLFPTGLSADQGSRGRPSGGQGSRGTPPPSGGQGGQGSRANPRPSQGGPTAVPRPPYQYRPYYGSRYYYPGYGYGYGYRYPGYYGYGYPGFYAGFYSPFFWGFGLGYGYGYGYGGYGYGYGPAYGYGYGQYPYPPYYYGPYYDNTGAARLQVSPRNTQVYIDGYFVGVVDNFDGNLQRLNVEAGEHELQLYLEGYRTFTQKVLFPRGGTLKVMHTMQPLGPGESAGLPPKPDEAMRARPSRPMPPDYQGPPPPERQGPPPDRQGPPPRAGQSAEFGSLLLRVRPSDADILVDGEAWNAPAGEDQFVIELTEGAHRIEVRKGGFQTYATTVRVRRGETARLNVSLTSGGLTGEF